MLLIFCVAAATSCFIFCVAIGLWKVAVVTGKSDVTGNEPNEQEKPASMNECRDNKNGTQAEKQPLKPNINSSKENTNNNAGSRNESKEQVEEAPREVPFPPTCRLVMVLYGDQGKTQPLFLGDNESVSEIKFQPETADKYIVSHYQYINNLGLIVNTYTFICYFLKVLCYRKSSSVFV